MRATTFLTVVIPLLMWTPACTDEARSPAGFALPDGDPERGKEVFIAMQCTTCHDVRGVDLPAGPDAAAPVHVTLGGEVTRVKNYGNLVTSVINPSHKLAPGYPREEIAPEGESRMANYNSVMTIAELIDLVAFLQTTYKVVRPEFEDYTYY